MVCHNCHSEIHSGLIKELPVAVLDEKILNYKSIKQESYYDNCYCGIKKKKINKFCSQACAKKFRRKINWEEIDLKFELQTLSVPQLADKLGCSDSCIYRKLKSKGIFYEHQRD